MRALATCLRRDADRSIRDLAALLFPPRVRNGRLALVTGYLDDSGSHRGARFLAIGGFVGRADGWAGFERAWDQIKENKGFSFLRAKTLRATDAPFRGWSRNQKRELITDLACALDKAVIRGIVGTVAMEDYEAVYGQDRGTPFHEAAYTWCFRACMVKMSHEVRETGERLSIVIEDRHENKGAILDAFERTKRSILTSDHFPLGNIAFASKEEFGALQAADFLVHHCYRNMEAILAGKPVHDELSDLLESMPKPIDVWPIDRHTLQLTRDSMLEVLESRGIRRQ